VQVSGRHSNSASLQSIQGAAGADKLDQLKQGYYCAYGQAIGVVQAIVRSVARLRRWRIGKLRRGSYACCSYPHPTGFSYWSIKEL